MPARASRPAFLRLMQSVNPIVTLVLRSRAQGLLSKSLMLLTVRGRKTGRDHTLPVQYAAAGNLIYVIPAAPHLKHWWRNLVGGAPVRILLGGQKIDGYAEVLTGRSDLESMIEGLKVYFGRFPLVARRRGVGRLPDGSFAAESLRSASQQTVLVRIRL